MTMERRIIDALKTIYDPEIPVDIYNLGLIYQIEVEEGSKVRVLMTLTSPNCPVAESLPEEVMEKLKMRMPHISKDCYIRPGHFRKHGHLTKS